MEYAAEWLDYLDHGRNYSAATVSNYAEVLRHFEEASGIHHPASVTAQDIESFMTRMGLSAIAASTRATRLYALRAFFRYLYDRQLIQANPAALIEPPKKRRNVISTLTPREIMKILNARPPLGKPQKIGALAEATYRSQRLAHVRDSAMIGLALAAALRAAEIRNFKVSDYHGDSVAVCGKGAKNTTILPLDSRIQRLIEQWLATRIEEGITSPFLFCSRDSGILSPTAIRRAILRRFEYVGIKAEGRRLSPHILRYTIATLLYAANRDIVAVSRHLRHGQIETTMSYIRLSAPSSQAILPFMPWNRLDLN